MNVNLSTSMISNMPKLSNKKQNNNKTQNFGVNLKLSPQFAKFKNESEFNRLVKILEKIAKKIKKDYKTSTITIIPKINSKADAMCTEFEVGERDNMQFVTDKGVTAIAMTPQELICVEAAPEIVSEAILDTLKGENRVLAVNNGLNDIAFRND